MNNLFSKKAYLALFAGIFVLEAVLSLWTGNEYDMTVWFNTGKWMQQGINIYMPDNHVGYLPLWPLWCDISYRVFVFSASNLELWRLTIKLPLIISHLALAFALGDFASNRFDRQTARKLFLVALTFSFFIFIGAMWGQINTLSALLTFLAFYSLTKKRIAISSLLLGVAVTLKIYPLVVLPAFFVYVLREKNVKEAAKLAILTISIPIVFTSIFFLTFQWDMTYLFRTIFYWAPVYEANPAQILGGCMNIWSFISVLGVEVSQSWPLRIVWIPVLFAAFVYWLRKRQTSEEALCLSVITLYGLFMITYAWIPEQTLVDPLPFILLQTIAFHPRKIYSYILVIIQILVYAFSATNWGPFVLSPLLEKFFPAGLAAISGFSPSNQYIWVARGVLGLAVSLVLGVFLLSLIKSSIVETVKNKILLRKCDNHPKKPILQNSSP